MGLKEMTQNVKYLGLPLLHTRRKTKDFDFILEKLDSKLAGWKAKTLSQAGRLTLIQAVGQALPVYTMQTIDIPKKICGEIDNRLRRFWWGQNREDNRGLCLRAWSKICTPKIKEALGFA